VGADEVIKVKKTFGGPCQSGAADHETDRRVVIGGNYSVL